MSDDESGQLRTYEEINERIRSGKVVVVTAEEMLCIIERNGPEDAAEMVDVVTTGTFGAMCSSGAFLNIGHSDPPIRIQRATLNRVPVFCGLAAVDMFIGATELRPGPLGKHWEDAYGGGHVIEALVKGEDVDIHAEGEPTDCYPRSKVDGKVRLADVNQAYIYNPRNAYQNYAVATNSTGRTLHTYMGKLLPRFGNANFATAGHMSPLLKDPRLRTIGIGTRIFLGGGVGMVIGEGTQFNTKTQQNSKGLPITPSRTLAVTGDLRAMSPRFLQGVTMTGYGVSLAVGLGVPIPILDMDILASVATTDADISARIFDYGVGARSRPSLGEVTYEQLRSGSIEIDGKKVRTSPLTSLSRSREVAEQLKQWIATGQFLLSPPAHRLPDDREFKPMGVR